MHVCMDHLPSLSLTEGRGMVQEGRGGGGGCLKKIRDVVAHVHVHMYWCYWAGMQDGETTF